MNNSNNACELINGKQYADGSYDRVAYFLPFAIEKNDFDMVKLLLKFKADPNARSRIGLPIIQAVKVGNLEIIRLLLEKGATLTECSNIFSKVAENENYFDIVQCLMKHNVEANEIVQSLAVVAAHWNINPEKAKITLKMMIGRGADLSATEDSEFEEKIPEAVFDFLRAHNIKT